VRQQQLVGVGGMTGDAILDPSGIYRYRLERAGLGWYPARPDRAVTFIMFNPSTADATADDPTIRRCKAFARTWGYGRLIVVNLFAYRATDPKVLLDAAEHGQDVVGPDNDSQILFAARGADLVVCAWGAHGGLLGRDAKVLTMLRQYGRSPHALGFTADGQPKHPLARGRSSIPADQKPIPMMLVPLDGGGPGRPAA
jgi:hypothetical protein